MKKTCKNCAFNSAENRIRGLECAMCITPRKGDPSQWRTAERLQTVKADAVNRPSHYTQGSVECIDAIKAATTGLSGLEGYCTGNIIKYLWRWKRKNGVQDLEKARWYLDRLILEKKLEAGNERS